MGWQYFMKCPRLFLLAAAALVAACDLGTEPAELPRDLGTYQVYQPNDYSANPQQDYPLIVFLHGGGELTEEDDVVLRFAQEQADFPFLLLTPYTASGWPPAVVGSIIAEVMDRFRVDEERIYLTGFGLGAVGALDLARAFPDNFAALALASGVDEPATACTLDHLPTWIFHNRADPVFDVQAAIDYAAALGACGGEVRLTIYETVPEELHPHNAWRRAFHTPALYEWLLAHERPDASGF